MHTCIDKQEILLNYFLNMSDLSILRVTFLVIW